MFPAHSFLLACIKIGLRIDDLKYLTFVDVLKIFYSLQELNNENNKKSGVRKATQQDIDKFFYGG